MGKTLEYIEQIFRSKDEAIAAANFSKYLIELNQQSDQQHEFNLII